MNRKIPEIKLIIKNRINNLVINMLSPLCKIKAMPKHYATYSMVFDWQNHSIF